MEFMEYQLHPLRHSQCRSEVILFMIHFPLTTMAALVAAISFGVLSGCSEPRDLPRDLKTNYTWQSSQDLGDAGVIVDMEFEQPALCDMTTHIEGFVGGELGLSYVMTHILDGQFNWQSGFVGSSSALVVVDSDGGTSPQGLDQGYVITQSRHGEFINESISLAVFGKGIRRLPLPDRDLDASVMVSLDCDTPFTVVQERVSEHAVLLSLFDLSGGGGVYQPATGVSVVSGSHEEMLTGEGSGLLAGALSSQVGVTTITSPEGTVTSILSLSTGETPLGGFQRIDAGPGLYAIDVQGASANSILWAVMYDAP